MSEEVFLSERQLQYAERALMEYDLGIIADPYTRVAMILFGLTVEEVGPNHRRAGKQIILASQYVEPLYRPN